MVPWSLRMAFCCAQSGNADGCHGVLHGISDVTNWRESERAGAGWMAGWLVVSRQVNADADPSSVLDGVGEDGLCFVDST